MAARSDYDGKRWALDLPAADNGEYHNAMITSYRSRSELALGPNTRLELTAHADGILKGTAGFGFWNHPYSRGIRLPQALWFFFSSPPSDMSLAMGVPDRIQSAYSITAAGVICSSPVCRHPPVCG